MSTEQLNLSPDIVRLRQERYQIDLETAAGYLLVKGVPYVSEGGEIKEGVLALILDMQGNNLAKPHHHAVFFIGERPYQKGGHVPIGSFNIATVSQYIGGSLATNFQISSRPSKGFSDHYCKAMHYIEIITSEVQL